jgi:hypothetical protein
MSAANLVEYFACGAGAPMCHVVQTLMETFFGILKRGDIEQTLIGLRVLERWPLPYP